MDAEKAPKPASELDPTLPDFIISMYTARYPDRFEGWMDHNKPELMTEFRRGVIGLTANETAYFVEEFIKDPAFPQEKFREFLGHDVGHFVSIFHIRDRSDPDEDVITILPEEKALLRAMVRLYHLQRPLLEGKGVEELGMADMLAELKFEIAKNNFKVEDYFSFANTLGIEKHMFIITGIEESLKSLGVKNEYKVTAFDEENQTLYQEWKESKGDFNLFIELSDKLFEKILQHHPDHRAMSAYYRYKVFRDYAGKDFDEVK